MIDLKKVFPRIKEVHSDEATVLTVLDGKTTELSYDDSPLMQLLAEDLMVSYALDMDTYYQFVQNKDLTADITLEQLHNASLNNMIQEISENIKFHGDPKNIIMITNGGNYEAAMILWNRIWPQIASIVGGDFYIAIPARDVLYVAPKSNPNAIERLNEEIQKLFNDENTQGLLVQHIYELIEDEWTVVKTS